MLHTSAHHRSNNGFTLIELSIVIAIIALLIGGVLAARDLIQSASLRSVISDQQRYMIAAKEFKTKYAELPGDFSAAAANWGTDSRGCPSNTSAVTTRFAGTCNGNGNGVIQSWANGNSNESWRAWQHLFLAKMIEQNTIGSTFTGPQSQWVGLTVPSSKIKSAGFSWDYYSLYSNVGAPLPVSNVLTFGKAEFANYRAIDVALTPSDAFYIDKKTDDGYPNTGNTRAFDGTCKLTNMSGTTYNLSEKGIVCGLLFVSDF